MGIRVIPKREEEAVVRKMRWSAVGQASPTKRSNRTQCVLGKFRRAKEEEQWLGLEQFFKVGRRQRVKR